MLRRFGVFVLLCWSCGGTGSPRAGSPEVGQDRAADSIGSDSQDAGSGGGTDTGADVVAQDVPADVALDTGGETGAPAMPVPGKCTPPLDIKYPYAKLTETGCVDPQNPRRMAGVVISYDLNSPLWSDAALKTRGMVIPAGAKIHVKDCASNPTECCVPNLDMPGQCLPPADDGKWVFPVGTVMVKNFMFADAQAGMKFLETRLFVRFDDKTWVGYGYRWNDAQTEATLVGEDGEDVTFNIAAPTGAQTVNWHYPSRKECMLCHTATKPGGGSVLGPETIQMNRMLTGGMNQLDKLQALGVFDAPPPKPYRTALVTPYAGPEGTPAASATVEARARSYLHANCAFCHRPDQPFDSIDLRFDVTAMLKNAKICNAVPAKGGLGVANATLLTPRSPATSVTWLRMNAPPADMVNGNRGRMPPVASNVVDSNGLKLVGDWINSIASCPL